MQHGDTIDRQEDDTDHQARNSESMAATPTAGAVQPDDGQDEARNGEEEGEDETQQGENVHSTGILGWFGSGHSLGDFLHRTDAHDPVLVAPRERQAESVGWK